MQAPTIIFDHVNKAVTVLSAGPATDRKLAELAAQQGNQVTTSGQPRK
ncbi:MAG: hypothetical protein M3433_02690 [Actinomycetota bacterium]|nr:hypothetical protein [Actinomycetota bacterium]